MEERIVKRLVVTASARKRHVTTECSGDVYRNEERRPMRGMSRPHCSDYEQ
jgi:hypothetical protein